MVANELQLGARLSRSAAAFGAALALAACAAHWYSTPTLSTATEHALWIERDVLCSLASGAFALASGALAGRVLQPLARRSCAS
jgi:hypothetical protein